MKSLLSNNFVNYSYSSSTLECCLGILSSLCVLGIYSWSKVLKLVKCYPITISLINCEENMPFQGFILCQHIYCPFNPSRSKRFIIDLKMSYTTTRDCVQSRHGIWRILKSTKRWLNNIYYSNPCDLRRVLLDHALHPMHRPFRHNLWTMDLDICLGRQLMMSKYTNCFTGSTLNYYLIKKMHACTKIHIVY